MASQKTIPPNIHLLLKARLVYYLITSNESTILSEAIIKYKNNKITFRKLDELARQIGFEARQRPLNELGVTEEGTDYSIIATYDQIMTKRY